MQNAWSVLIAIVLFLLTLYFVKVYLKGSSTIILDQEKISIHRESFYWTDLSEIQITGKINLHTLFGIREEGTTLKFTTNDEPLYIIDSYYQNSAEIKSFIYIHSKAFKNCQEKPLSVSSTKVLNDFFVDFKGSAILSFRGMILWGFIIFMIYIFFFTPSPLANNERLALILFFSALWFCLNAYSMYYFSLSQKYFKIRNHYFLWVNKDFELDDIFEIIFESHPKQANRLRIITKEFKSSVYLAGSLSDEEWLELKVELEKQIIKVRNECI